MARLIKQTDRLNQKQRKQTYTIALLEEKNVGCRWTVGRLGKLQRIIKTGGRGRDSQFCGAYKNRLKELSEQHCQNQTSAFAEVCV